MPRSRVAALLLLGRAAAALSTRLTHCLQLAQRPWVDGAAPTGLVADVCCDHGYLAAELSSLGRAVVAVDACADPLANCRRHYAWRGLEPVAFVLGDGVEAVQRDERLPWCETAVVAGVGARFGQRGTEARVAAALRLSDDRPSPRRHDREDSRRGLRALGPAAPLRGPADAGLDRVRPRPARDAARPRVFYTRGGVARRQRRAPQN